LFAQYKEISENLNPAGIDFFFFFYHDRLVGIDPWR